MDFLLSEHRDVAAAKRFFCRAIRHKGTPRVITLDAYAASHRVTRELKCEVRTLRRLRIRSSKYLNHIVEQDHRRIKQRIGPMLGFKRFGTATVTISGIELAEKIKKAQFKIGKVAKRPATMPAVLGGCSGRLSETTDLVHSESYNIGNLHQSPIFTGPDVKLRSLAIGAQF